MVKLQKIERKDGTLVYSINIPIDIINTLCWSKGDELGVDIIENNIIIKVI